ncbi:MAG TPA: DMT family transporter [Longimicrobiaceae bacterium]|nr:DMT family transporter [Longimicrobiaceae bacterium]
MPSRTTSRLQLIAAAALFSTGGAAIKAVTLSSWQVAGFRSGIAALTVLLLVPAARRGWSWRVVMVAGAYAATMVLFVAANKLTTAANTIFLQSTAPLYILLLGPLLLRERITREDLVFMAVVAFGLSLFFVGVEEPAVTAPNPARGDLLAALAGFTWALTILGLRWLGSGSGGEGGGGEGALATVVIGNALAFLVCLPMALPVVDASAVDWALVGYLGIFQVGVAYLFLTSGIRHIPALEAATLLLVEPALNPIWAWLIHDETPSSWALVGGAAILSATVVKTWWDERSSRAGEKWTEEVDAAG